jgi:hypothetical protein
MPLAAPFYHTHTHCDVFYLCQRLRLTPQSPGASGVLVSPHGVQHTLSRWLMTSQSWSLSNNRVYKPKSVISVQHTATFRSYPSDEVSPRNAVTKAYCNICVCVRYIATLYSNFFYRDTSVLGYGLDDRGSIPGGGWEFFSSPPLPERLWGPPSLLSNVYQSLFPCG